jgi:cathepsin L
MTKALSLFALALAAASASARDYRGYTFEQFMKEFNLKYTRGELSERRSIFDKELARIKSHNSGGASYQIGVNQFSALTKKEKNDFHGRSKGAKAQHKPKNLRNLLKSVKHTDQLPASVDWRDEGIVTPVKDQGHCGSCWAFAATAVLESHVAKESGLLFDLSPQQISMCAPNPDSCGVAGSDGLFQEFAYPYTAYYGEDSTCAPNDAAVEVAGIEGYVQLQQNNYTELMNAVATYGPIAVSVDASEWHAYEGGVFDGCNQEQPDINHAVTLVGYGSCPIHGDYWLVRNSWSPAWGEKGYIKIRRNGESDEENCGQDITPQDGVACAGETDPVKVCGTCGILYDSAYPTGAHAFATDEDGRKP